MKKAILITLLATVILIFFKSLLLGFAIGFLVAELSNR
jgi:hypothetical protein